MRSALAVAAIALAGAGCSVDEDETSRRDARAAVETFFGACAAGKGEAALDLLTPLERATFLDAGSPRAGCATVMGISERVDAPLAQRFRESEVHEVAVEGGLGSATVQLGGGDRVELDLEQAGGTWHVGTTGR